MKLKQILLIASLVAAPIGGMMLHSWWTSRDANTPSAQTGSGDVKTIEWPTLAQYDLKSGKPTDLLKELVPLEDNMKLVKEFLLVPDPQACIHYPPPPPNQQVLVQMVGDESASVDWKPVWIEGHLRITSGTTKYGTAIFQVKARRTEAYKAGF